MLLSFSTRFSYPAGLLLVLLLLLGSCKKDSPDTPAKPPVAPATASGPSQVNVWWCYWQPGAEWPAPTTPQAMVFDLVSRAQPLRRLYEDAAFPNQAFHLW